jgi:hypothetical protein
MKPTYMAAVIHCAGCVALQSTKMWLAVRVAATGWRLLMAILMAFTKSCTSYRSRQMRSHNIKYQSASYDRDCMGKQTDFEYLY